MNERDKELLIESKFPLYELYAREMEKFAALIRADEREAILELADSLGWVDVDAIRARGNT
jgi:hypothetical protein